MIIDSALKEKLAFYSENFKTIEAIQSLHPIDMLLLINAQNPSLSFRWLKTLEIIGVNYTTPCVWVNTTKDWNRYYNSINNVLLAVSNNAFLIASNDEVIAKSGKLVNMPDYKKDVYHVNAGRLLFTHKTSKAQYMNEVLNVVKEELYV